jgi:hypothetical protein
VLDLPLCLTATPEPQRRRSTCVAAAPLGPRCPQFDFSSPVCKCRHAAIRLFAPGTQSAHGGEGRVNRCPAFDAGRSASTLFACSFSVLYTSLTSFSGLHSLLHKMASRSKPAAPAAVKKPLTAPKKVRTRPGRGESSHQSCLGKPVWTPLLMAPCRSSTASRRQQEHRKRRFPPCEGHILPHRAWGWHVVLISGRAEPPSRIEPL